MDESFATSNFIDCLLIYGNLNPPFEQPLFYTALKGNRAHGLQGDQRCLSQYLASSLSTIRGRE